jgi:hypothetical protein
MIINRYNIHIYIIFTCWIESCQWYFVSWKHTPKNIYLCKHWLLLCLKNKNQLVVQPSLTSDNKEASVNEQMYSTVVMSPTQYIKHQLGMNAHLSRDWDNKVSRAHIQLDQLVHLSDENDWVLVS